MALEENKEDVKFEVISVPLEEFIVTDADYVDNDTAFELAKELERFVINIPGGKKNISSIDRDSLKAVLEATEPKKDETV